MVCFVIKYNTNLGNWLFQYAAAQKVSPDIGIALEDESLLSRFEPMRAFLCAARVCMLQDLEDVPVFKERQFRYAALPRFDGDVVLDGFFQSEKYFDKGAVMAKFGITPEREKELRGKYGDWLDRPHVTGISVRKGADYREQCFLLPFVGERYFRDCIARVPECNDFIVCSDNLPWCKDWFPKAFPGKRFLFVEGESVLNQLYVQTLCRNNILSNSSFSWWGGWLNAHPDKKVFAPSMWFGPFARYAKIDWQDLYADCMTVVANRPTLGEWFDMQIRCWWKIFKIEYVKRRRRVLGW